MYSNLSVSNGLCGQSDVTLKQENVRNHVLQWAVGHPLVLCIAGTGIGFCQGKYGVGGTRNKDMCLPTHKEHTKCLCLEQMTAFLCPLWGSTNHVVDTATTHLMLSFEKNGMMQPKGPPTPPSFSEERSYVRPNAQPFECSTYREKKHTAR